MRNSLLLILFVLFSSACTEQKSNLEYLASDAPETGYMGFKSNFVELDGLIFHYVDQGNTDDAILFLHGFPYFSESWYKVMNAFAETHYTVAPDNRGYGYTDKPVDVNAYRLEVLTDDVVALLEALPIQGRLLLVGHDWGAVLAAAVAQRYPERVDKLVLINGAPLNTFLQVLENSELQRERSKYINRLDGWIAKTLYAIRGANLFWRGASRLYDEGHIDENFKRAYLNAWQQPGAAQAAVNWYKANIPEFDEIQDSDYWPSKSSSIEVPTLLIWSKDDPAFTQDVFNAIPNFISNLRIEVINTDSHVPFLDHSDLVIEHIAHFIEAPVVENP